jgi:hypothetical protein
MAGGGSDGLGKCRECTRDERPTSLRTTLAEALELNRPEAIRAAVPDYTKKLVTA